MQTFLYDIFYLFAFYSIVKKELKVYFSMKSRKTGYTGCVFFLCRLVTGTQVKMKRLS